MPSIQGSLEAFQPLIDVSIARSHADARFGYRALVDTGATRSCISRAIVERHGLEYRTKVLVQSADSHPVRRPAYAFSLGLFCMAITGESGRTLYVLSQELIAPAILETSSFDVILGMDLLSCGRLIFDRGSFSFDFPESLC